MIMRFAIPLPRNLSPIESRRFIMKTFVIVQVKVLNFIAEWLDKRRQDFQDDSFLHELVKAFLQRIS